MTATPDFLDSAVEEKSTASPPSSKVPESRRCTPATTLTSVDLPAPFSPTRAWIEPASTRRLPERRATTGPNDLETSRSSSTGAAALLAGMWLLGLKGFNGTVGEGRHTCQPSPRAICGPVSARHARGRDGVRSGSTNVSTPRRDPRDDGWCERGCRGEGLLGQG